MRRKPRPAAPDHRQPWQIEQAARCPCRGSDDYCACQNVDQSDPAHRQPTRADLELRIRELEGTVASLELQQKTDRQTIAALSTQDAGGVDVEALPKRLCEAAEWLSEDIPAGTPEIQHLEGDVRLDELDLYCVNLMREAADTINGHARALGIALTALETIQGMEPITHEITLPTVMAQHAVDALSDIKALGVEVSDVG